MDKALLIDFGSTYTKVVAVDLQGEKLLGVAQAPSTVDKDIMVGLSVALDSLEGVSRKGVETGEFEKRACSSAAGGLRMVAVGLVKELTAEAAKRAALGAGAKVLGTFAHGLCRADLRELEDISPDIILLAGGTDGGNRDVLIHNAQFLAQSRLDVPVVIAGNKIAADEAGSLLTAAGKYAIVSENVMPELNVLNVEPARANIRSIFMERIVHAKGLNGAQSFIGEILMPTPLAVLNGARLVGEGTENEPGLGELMVVDVGGATTDVHSVAEGAPTQAGVVLKGLPEPYVKRTVEGDLGIRYNARHILEMAGTKRILGNIPPESHLSASEIDLKGRVNFLSNHTDAVPRNGAEFAVDMALARTAVDMATERHAGTVEQVFTPQGKIFLQYGKDLSQVRVIIGTGGIFSYGRLPVKILEAALCNPQNPLSLRPKGAQLLVDERYILYAIGLLSEVAPEKALRIVKKHLKMV